MSRSVLRTVEPMRKPPEDEDDHCPVCKSKRYLNPNMRFLINPECYHKMCESCVDRIFSHGPALCPIAGCHKTLRKNKFRRQTFEDIKVEREVDVRRRVAKVFNRREEDFQTLMDYNNYLNDVEDITYNLIHKIDLDATEAKLEAYEHANKAAISENDSLAARDAAARRARQAVEREQTQLRREAARREDEEEKREKLEGRRDVINRLATGQGDANVIAKAGQKAVLRKSLTRRTASDRQQSSQAASTFTGGVSNGAAGAEFVIKGLRHREKPAAVEEEEYDPFGGYSDEKDYYVLQKHYDYELLDRARTDARYTAGGYDPREFYAKALCEAFLGLGVFVGEELPGKDVAAAPDMTMAAATMAAVDKPDIKMEDVSP